MLKCCFNMVATCLKSNREPGVPEELSARAKVFVFFPV